MPVSQTLLTNNVGGSGTSYDTASVAPTSGRVIIVMVHSRDNSSPHSVPTLSGLSMTWTQIATKTQTDATLAVGNTVTFFRGVANGNSGAITISFASTQARIGWGVIELVNVDAGGTNGSNAIVQTATNGAYDGSGSVGATLGAFSDANNATMAGFILNGTNPAWTPEAGYTEIFDQTSASFCRGMVEFLASNDTTPRATMVMDEGTQEYASVAMELKFLVEESASPSLSPSLSPSASESRSPSSSASPSSSPSLSPSASESPSPSASASPSSSPSLSPSASESPSPSSSESRSPSSSASPSASPSLSPSLSPSASESRSISVTGSESSSPSSSISLSPSFSPSPSSSESLSPSLSPSVSPSLSPSPSPSATESFSPSETPSASPSLSPSASQSPSPSTSISASISPSQEPGTGLYSKEALANLPTNSEDLAIIYGAEDEVDVSTDNAVRVPQVGSTNYIAHQFKKENNTNRDSIKVLVNLQSTLAPSATPLYLQVWNDNSGAWETIDTDNAAGANTDFDLTTTITSDVANYYDSDYIVAFRVQQYINGVAHTISVDLVDICFIIVYADKYSDQSTTYTDKYSDQATEYTDKYTVKRC